VKPLACSPLIEAGSFFAAIGVTAGELMTAGGNLTLGVRSFVQDSELAAPSVDIRPGAVIDVSGGWVRYDAGIVKTSRLRTADGRIVDIGDADPNDNFVAVVDTVTASQDRFGFAQGFINQSAEEPDFEPSYTEGRDAGSLTIKASTTSLGATIFGDAFAGTLQVADGREASKAATIDRDARTLQTAPTELPSGALLKITALGSGTNTLAGGADIIVFDGRGAAPARPLRAMRLPSSEVMIEPLSPGVLSRIEVVEPPYMAP